MVNGTLVIRCKNWVLRALGEGILFDRKERAMRILEEAAELAQCEGVTMGEADAVTARVFSRPKGDAPQEMAGVLFTLLVYSWVTKYDLELALLRELERVEDPMMIRRVRAKHEDKVAAGIGRPL
jgi:hypothetical protein